MTAEWSLRTTSLSLERPLLMGILNVTPDSFSDGGLAETPERAMARARWLVERGADIVDVGGESTRPGADPVTLDEELDRVVPVIRGLAGMGIVTSVDTMKPDVARAAVEAGAEIVNDVGGMGDPEMRRAAAQSGVGVVVVHMRGNPRTMQQEPVYDDVVGEVGEFLAARAWACVDAGIDPGSICVDPGIGFGKTLEHNLTLLDELDVLVDLGYPVALGASRKRFLGVLLGRDDPRERDVATAAVTALAVERGVAVIRVHDPGPSADAARVARAIVSDRTRRRRR